MSFLKNPKTKDFPAFPVELFGNDAPDLIPILIFKPKRENYAVVFKTYGGTSAVDVEI